MLIDKINKAIRVFETGVVHEDIITGKRFTLDPGVTTKGKEKNIMCGKCKKIHLPSALCERQIVSRKKAPDKKVKGMARGKKDRCQY